MDPHLESHWLDVHTKLVAYAADVMNTLLPDDLAASTEERVAVESDDEFEQRFHLDVQVFQPSAGSPTMSETSPRATTAAPIRLVLEDESAIERFVRIVETGTERLISVIEFISPSNKRKPGLLEFRNKRTELIAAGVNVVEVDLVRAGDWQALLRPHRCPVQSITTYRATIRTPADPGAVGLYPMPLREPLPPIIIPLRAEDPEVKLALQPLIDQAYVNGRYARRLNYNQPPSPPLEPADQQWVSTLRQ